jgi:hypothetical protein
MLDRTDKPTNPSEAIQSFITRNHNNDGMYVEKIVLVFMNTSLKPIRCSFSLSKKN